MGWLKAGVELLKALPVILQIVTKMKAMYDNMVERQIEKHYEKKNKVIDDLETKLEAAQTHEDRAIILRKLRTIRSRDK